jgi:hypothetical protein
VNAATTPDKPRCLHREEDVRTCLTCGAYLSSANEDECCSLHGGWTLQRYLLTERERERAFEELIAA